MTQAISRICLTIHEIVFLILKIELKSVFLRYKTSMKTCYPGHTDWNTTDETHKIEFKRKHVMSIIFNHSGSIIPLK